MGWAVRRADGTYRAWCRNAKDEALRANETYVAMDTPPEITESLARQREDPVRDAYLEAKRATLAMIRNPNNADRTRQAIVSQGQLLEALLKALNRRMA